MKRIFIICIALAAALATSCQKDSASSDSGGGGGDSQGGSMARFTINGDYLYTVTAESSPGKGDQYNLTVFSIADPAKPLNVTDVYIGIDAETIFTMGDWLFIGSQRSMQIYDVTNPAFPERLTAVSHFKSCDPVVAYGNLAFVTLNSSLGWWCGSTGNVLQVYDITDIKNPVRLSETQLSSPRGLAVDGAQNLVFVCDKDMVKVFDITDPNDPKGLYTSSLVPEVKRIDAYDCIVTNGRLLVVGADGLYQLAYDREKFTFISKIDLRGEQL